MSSFKTKKPSQVSSLDNAKTQEDALSQEEAWIKESFLQRDASRAREAAWIKEVLADAEPKKIEDKQDINVLCLEGGGVKGRMQLEVLKILEAVTNKSLLELFDVFGGTSVGALIIAGITLPKEKNSTEPLFPTVKTFTEFFDEICSVIFPPKTPTIYEKVVDAFLNPVNTIVEALAKIVPPISSASPEPQTKLEKWSEKIFHKFVQPVSTVIEGFGKIAPGVSTPSHDPWYGKIFYGFLKAKYDPAPLYNILAELGKDLTLTDTLKPVIIPVYQWTDRDPGVMATMKAQKSQDDNYPLKQTLAATTAAPGYFPSVKGDSIANSKPYQVFKDGGLTPDNNPSKQAYILLHPEYNIKNMITITMEELRDKGYMGPFDFELDPPPTPSIKHAIKSKLLSGLSAVGHFLKLDGGTADMARNNIYDICVAASQAVDNKFLEVTLKDAYLPLKIPITKKSNNSLDDASPKNLQELIETTQDWIKNNGNAWIKGTVDKLVESYNQKHPENKVSMNLELYQELFATLPPYMLSETTDEGYESGVAEEGGDNAVKDQTPASYTEPSAPILPSAPWEEDEPPTYEEALLYATPSPVVRPSSVQPSAPPLEELPPSKLDIDADDGYESGVEEDPKPVVIAVKEQISTSNTEPAIPSAPPAYYEENISYNTTLAPEYNKVASGTFQPPPSYKKALSSGGTLAPEYNKIAALPIPDKILLDSEKSVSEEMQLPLKSPIPLTNLPPHYAPQDLTFNEKLALEESYREEEDLLDQLMGHQVMTDDGGPSEQT